MNSPGNSGSPERLVVFRPRRRCERCGLVNVDGARRCRRCYRSFSGIDSGVESERFYRKVQTRRAVSLAILLTLVAGLAGAYLLYRSRTERLARFERDVRLLEGDVLSLRRAALGDARMLLRAFDDAEAMSVLAAQAPVWVDRAERCSVVSGRLEELVPATPEQARKQVGLRSDLGSLAAASTRMVSAAGNADLDEARETARAVVDAAGAHSAQQPGG